MIASRWVDEMRERVREKKSTRRQNNYSGGKKQYKTKQNKVRLGGKQTAVAAEGKNRSWKSGSRIKKRRKKIVEKKILIRRRRIKAEKAHQDVQSEAVWSWKVQICNSFKLAN